MPILHTGHYCSVKCLEKPRRHSSVNVCFCRENHMVTSFVSLNKNLPMFEWGVSQSTYCFFASKIVTVKLNIFLFNLEKLIQFNVKSMFTTPGSKNWIFDRFRFGSNLCKMSVIRCRQHFLVKDETQCQKSCLRNKQELFKCEKWLRSNDEFDHLACQHLTCCFLNFYWHAFLRDRSMKEDFFSYQERCNYFHNIFIFRDLLTVHENYGSSALWNVAKSILKQQKSIWLIGCPLPLGL